MDHPNQDADTASSSSQKENGKSPQYNGNANTSEVNYGVTEQELDDAYKDQLIRDSQAKIEQEIITNFPLVSDLINIDRLHGEYSSEDAIYQQKVEDLKLNYCSMRKTRPDGNCFFRAFIFAYFESLIGDLPEQTRFVEICKVTRKGIADVLGFPDFTIDEFYEYFDEIVKLIVASKITTADELLNELNQPAVYDNIVVYLRLLTSYYLQKESDFFANFIEGCGQIGDFCKREVEPMYKESDHIHISALSSVLDVTVRIVYMDRGAGGKVNEHDFSPLLKEDRPPQEPRIHLLYRPGHYDVLYVGSHASSSTNGTSTASSSSSQPLNLMTSPKSPLIVQQEEADSSSNNPRSPAGAATGPAQPPSPLSPHYSSATPPLSPAAYLPNQVTPQPSPRPAQEPDESDSGVNSTTQPDSTM